MQVKVNQGLLEGCKRQSALNGREFYCFMGIPYAEPPVGDFRFRPPVPAKSWKGVRSTTEEKSSCIQTEFYNNQIFGSEDCLYLNVYTPKLPKPDAPLQAVMVYIHGGGFSCGSGSMDKAGPDYLINHDIILVTINYRLHILGFLNLNIPSCSGNYGLKDQSLALKWVKENIQSFGGDPNNVTIFGESAGGSSVQYHMISPMSKGLFQRAIMQSGSVLSPWALLKGDPSYYGYEVSRTLGFEEKDPEKLVAFLRKQPIDKLYSAVQEVTNAIKKQNQWNCCDLPFIPSIEKLQENAFLPDTPENLLKISEPIPAICGVNEIEGIIILLSIRNPTLIDITKDLTDIVKINVPCKPDKISDVVAKIKEFYFHGELSQDEKFRQFINLYSDLYFLSLYVAVDYITKSKQPIYFYEFTFDGDLNQFKNFPFSLKIKGAKHADEIGYLFYGRKLFPKASFSGPEKKVLESLCTLWSNFAKTGNPTADISQVGVEWKPHTEEKPTHLNIGSELKCLEEKIWNERRNFWTDMMKDSRIFTKSGIVGFS